MATLTAQQEIMLSMAKKAQLNAYAPYSQFHVGVCIHADNGEYFAGGNIENGAYPSSQCAEGSAIGAMITHGGKKIRELLVVSPNESACPPCGNCRQMISEHAASDCKIHLANSNGEILEIIAFGDLLPNKFVFDR